jgi:hypothetical protein
MQKKDTMKWRPSTLVVALVGVQERGRVFECQGTHVATEFFCLSSLPLWPLRSYACTRGATIERVRIPLNGVSIAAAYLRGVAPWLSMAGICAFSIDHMTAALEELRFVSIVVGVLAICGFFVVGRPDAYQAACWRIYARSTGMCTDPARLGENRKQLVASLTRRLEGHPLERVMAHRDEARGSEWLTLLRLEWSLADAPDLKLAYAEQHERLWRLLSGSQESHSCAQDDPPVVDEDSRDVRPLRSQSETRER